MERIKLDATSVGCGALAGLVLGCAGGYLLCSYLNRARLEERVTEEVNAVRDYYKSRAASPAVGDGKLPDSERPEDDDLEAYMDASDEDEEGVDVDNFSDEDDDDPEDSAFPAKRDPSRPYVISVVEFSDREAGDGWTQLAMTWYSDGNTLVDEHERPVPDIIRTTGPLSLAIFRENGVSGDPNRLYIRNERIRHDFEIILNQRSYADVVLNYGNPSRPDG